MIDKRGKRNRQTDSKIAKTEDKKLESGELGK